MNIEINIQHAVLHVKNPEPSVFTELVEVESDHVDPESHRKLQRAFDTLTSTHTELRNKHESLVADYNRLADSLVKMNNAVGIGTKPLDALETIIKQLDALGPISPF